MISGIDSTSVFDSTIEYQNTSKIPYSIVAAGTGAGKTTTYPAKLAKSGVQINGRPFKVLVILPTKDAVDNAYNVAKNNKTNSVRIDFSVGRARDGDIEYHNYKNSIISNTVSGYPLPKTDDDDTVLVFCTTGHAKNRIQEWFKYLTSEDVVSQRSLNVYDYIIVDEAHLRNKNMDIDLILGMLKSLHISFPNKSIPQIVLTSATYKEQDVHIYNIPDVHPFTKEIYYMGLEGEYETKLESIAGGLYEFITTSSYQPNVILLFLPGIREIEKVKRGMENLDKYTQVFEYNILHSDIPREERMNAFKPNTPGKWKLILSTNIAETSLTIPNVLIVVDFPYEKIRVVGANQTVKTQVQMIAKDSANQRAGRTGRTNNGIVIRLLSHSQFESLPESIDPEIERLPIGNEILKILDCNIDYRKIFNRNPGKISEKQQARINATLRELAYFDLVTDCNGHYSVTQYGRFIADLPLTNKCGIIVLKAIYSGIDIYPAIVLACMIEAAEDLFVDGRVPPDFKSKIPLESILKPWLIFCLNFGVISLPKKKNALLVEFCKENKIKYETFREAQRKIILCITIIRNKGYDVDINIFEPEDCFIKMKSILSSIFFKYKMKRVDGRVVYVSINDKIKHKPLVLNNKYLTYNTEPENVVSIMNLEFQGNTNMMLWFPTVYEPTEEYKSGYISEKVSAFDYQYDEDDEDDDQYIDNDDIDDY